MTVVFDLDKAGPYSHFRLVDHCVSLSCIFPIGNKVTWFSLEASQNQLLPSKLTNPEQSGLPMWILCYFQSILQKEESFPALSPKLPSSLTDVNAVSTRQMSFKVQLSGEVKKQSSANLLQVFLSTLDKYKRGSNEKRGNVYERVAVLRQLEGLFSLSTTSHTFLPVSQPIQQRPSHPLLISKCSNPRQLFSEEKKAEEIS